jgi:putative PIN family toxin of toxin-antitoxin system
VTVVFDTNVLIAAFLSEGVCSKLLMRARRREFSLVLSDDILAEFQKVLHTKFRLSRSELSEVRKLLMEAVSDLRRDVTPIGRVCRDPDDDKILACAVLIAADYLVTGDQDLLAITQYEQVRIVTPRDFESRFPD